MGIIKNWLVTGDTHQEFSRLDRVPNKEDVGVIILGDAGFNFYIYNNYDHRWKKKITKSYKFTIYCVRGNHEARPQEVSGMINEWDDNVCGYVYYQKEYPRIRYFKDYGLYNIISYNYKKDINNHFTIAVIGGAYSVDKNYRLRRAGLTERDNDPAKSGWWNNEQLSEFERINCRRKFCGEYVDFVFSHTCPLSWQPTDMFLDVVTDPIDSSMEKWLNELKEEFYWQAWAFGHYHIDRIIAPGIECYFKDISNIQDILRRKELCNNVE